MAKRSTWSPPGPYRIGDWVKITSFGSSFVGQVIEDDGLIGHERRHSYTIRFPTGVPDEPWMISGSPADRLAPATPEEVEAALKEAEHLRRLSV